MAVTSFSRTGLENPILTVAVILGGALFVPYSLHPDLAALAWFTMAISILLLRRVYGPPVLILAVGLQLAQASAILLKSSLEGVPITQLPGNGRWIEDAVWLACSAVIALAFGMRIGSGRRLHDSPALYQTISPEAALRLYILTYAAAGVFALIGRLGGGQVSQLALQLGGVRWIGLFILYYASLKPGGRPIYALIALLLDVGIGLTGFFASFKETFYVAIMAVMVSGARITVARSVALTAMAASLITLMAFWSAIKMDYRQFLNRGSGAQVVVQELEDRVNYVADQFANADLTLMYHGLSRLIDRVSYVYYLGRAMQNVPANLPHEDGALLGAAVTHIMTPRLLFPDKPPLPSDSVITAKYANMGTYYVKMSGNTSVSIGYVGELYVDFGYAGAVIACLGLGFVYGLIHRKLCNYPALPSYMNYGTSVMVLLNTVQFEQALIKTIGSVIASFVVALLLRRYVLPWLLAVSLQIDSIVADQSQESR